MCRRSCLKKEAQFSDSDLLNTTVNKYTKMLSRMSKKI